jgi:glucose-6-phosphate 1-dehydrogenase
MAGIVGALGSAGLTDGARVIMEKPFGTDLASARALNEAVHSVFDEEQIFRIDHFLGKESVQNILALRFANGLFEPVWNRDHVDHVQIDVPETLSIGGRAGFYEGTGAFRDMIVTHLFQVLGFVAMEPPTSLDPKALVDEKLKVFEAMKPLDPERVVRGQYEGYLEEEGVAPGSQTETFVALEVEIENWRWAGVPFFLRTGKRLAQGRRVITVGFKEPPLAMFPTRCPYGPNELVFEVAEPGAIRLNFLAKIPGETMELCPAAMEFDYADSFCIANQLEAYERLIHDAMIGDRTLFTRAGGIERLWEVATPLLESLPPLHPYAPGSWGPDAVHDLVAPRRWHLPDGR